MAEYEDDSCYSCFEGHQALHLLGWSPPNSQRANVGDNNQDQFEMEDQRISRMLKTLENKLLVEKDHEIEKLRDDLLIQTENKKYFENLADSYANYIAVLRVQFGSLINGITSNFVGDTSRAGNTNTPNELLCTLKSVSNKLANQVEIESPLGFLLKQVIDALNANKNLEPAVQCISAVPGLNGGIVDFGSAASNANNIVFPSTERVQNENVTEPLISQKTTHDNQSNSDSLDASYGAQNSHDDQIDVTMLKLKCSACSDTFTCNSELQKHCQRVHQIHSHTNIEYKCFICKITFNTLSDCNSHFNNTHNHNVRATEPEPNQNDDNIQLDENAETESQRSTNLTNECSSSFENKSSKHGVDHSKTKPGYLFVCLCGFVHRKMSDLEKHINRHSTLLKIKCLVCPTWFPYLSAMESHMKKSHKVKEINEKGVVCSVCHGRFDFWKKFEAHLTTIHNITSESYPKVGMDNHKRDFTRKEAYFCICGKSYSSECTLKNHFRKMKFDKVFKCVSCDRQYSSNSELQRHIRRHHTGHFR